MMNHRLFQVLKAFEVRLNKYPSKLMPLLAEGSLWTTGTTSFEVTSVCLESSCFDRSVDSLLSLSRVDPNCFKNGSESSNKSEPWWK